MPTSQFLSRCREITANGTQLSTEPGCSEAPPVSDADSLIGMFQHFRPDAHQVPELFGALSGPLGLGDRLAERLTQVYQVAGDNRRPSGGRDAYFVVRSPEKLTVEATEQHGLAWLKGIAEIANAVGDTDAAGILSNPPKLRVLEGIPPKHPKPDQQRSDLLKVLLERADQWTAGISDADPHAELLRPAYYFIACDHMLRDHLMWPFYAQQTGLDDPLGSYFWLWSHGVKYRTFQEGQLDLYLPRGLAD